MAMFRGERRAGRVPVAMYCELIVDDEVLPAFVTSLSENGLYFDSLAILSHRKSNRVQMQLTLPGEEDPLWIVGDVIYDERGRLFNETAVRFVEMADAHKRALRRWIRVRELVITTQPGRLQQENAA